MRSHAILLHQLHLALVSLMSLVTPDQNTTDLSLSFISVVALCASWRVSKTSLRKVLGMITWSFIGIHEWNGMITRSFMSACRSVFLSKNPFSMNSRIIIIVCSSQRWKCFPQDRGTCWPDLLMLRKGNGSLRMVVDGESPEQCVLFQLKDSWISSRVWSPNNLVRGLWSVTNRRLSFPSLKNFACSKDYAIARSSLSIETKRNSPG